MMVRGVRLRRTEKVLSRGSGKMIIIISIGIMRMRLILRIWSHVRGVGKYRGFRKRHGG